MKICLVFFSVFGVMTAMMVKVSNEIESKSVAYCCSQKNDQHNRMLMVFIGCLCSCFTVDADDAIASQLLATIIHGYGYDNGYGATGIH